MLTQDTRRTPVAIGAVRQTPARRWDATLGHPPDATLGHPPGINAGATQGHPIKLTS